LKLAEETTFQIGTIIQEPNGKALWLIIKLTNNLQNKNYVNFIKHTPSTHLFMINLEKEISQRVLLEGI